MKTIHLICSCGAELRQHDLDHRVDMAAEEFRAQHATGLCAVTKRAPREESSQ